MFELVIGFSTVMIAAAVAPKPKKNEKKRIKMIFENTGFGIKNKAGEMEYPTFEKKLPIKIGDEEIGMRYVYSIPLGLAVSKITEKEAEWKVFSDGLNHPVTTEYKTVEKDDPRKYLVVSVYNKDIPESFPYKLIPSVKNEWLLPLGKSLEDIIWVDFENIPHMTIAGVTRFGKTVFLKVLTTYMIEHHPDDVEFWIVDLKGGLEFGRYGRLQQVKFVAGDYIEAFVMASQLHIMLHEDLNRFKQMGITNIKNSRIKRRRFIIVDEAAQLAAESFMTRKLKDMEEMEPFMNWIPEEMRTKGSLKDLLNYTQWMLSEIARLGGGLGYRLIYCTQYPTADTLPRQIKMNADSKITFRLPTGYASEVAIDAQGAEKLPRDVPGRMLYKTHDLQQMQAPFLSDEEMWKRLEKYQVPRLRKGNGNGKVVYDGETNPSGTNSEHTGSVALRNESPAPNHPQVRLGPERP